MELHKNTANAFINYLKTHGYPGDRIVTEWNLGKYRVDIAVLDNDNNLPVAIYEVKGPKTNHSINEVKYQLDNFINELGYPVQAGAVFSKETPPYFEFVNVTGKLGKSKLQRLDDVDYEYNVEPMSWENLKNSTKPKLEKRIEEKKRKKLDTFSIISWILACITMIILMLEHYEFITFSTERLVVYGAIILLIILPFFSEIKFGETFFKRDNNEK